MNRLLPLVRLSVWHLCIYCKMFCSLYYAFFTNFYLFFCFCFLVFVWTIIKFRRLLHAFCYGLFYTIFSSSFYPPVQRCYLIRPTTFVHLTATEIFSTIYSFYHHWLRSVSGSTDWNCYLMTMSYGNVRSLWNRFDRLCPMSTLTMIYLFVSRFSGMTKTVSFDWSALWAMIVAILIDTSLLHSTYSNCYQNHRSPVVATWVLAVAQHLFCKMKVSKTKTDTIKMKEKLWILNFEFRNNEKYCKIMVLVK